jgi:hypothetical protein
MFGIRWWWLCLIKGASMDNKQIARRLVELCRQKKYVQAIDELYADNATGREDHGEGAEMNGKAAIREGTVHWLGAFELPEHQIDEPLYCGDKFAVRFSGRMVKTDGSGEHKYEEVGVYTLRDGKIVSQEFFYDM